MLFHLLTGETITGELVRDDAEAFILKRPFALTDSDSGVRRYDLIPYAHHGRDADVISVMKSAVVYVLESPEEISRLYRNSCM